MSSAWPAPRKKPPPRASKLDAFKPVIDEILRVDLDAPRKQRHTVTRIYARLIDEHAMAAVSYQVPTGCWRPRWSSAGRPIRRPKAWWSGCTTIWRGCRRSRNDWRSGGALQLTCTAVVSMFRESAPPRLTGTPMTAPVPRRHQPTPPLRPYLQNAAGSYYGGGAAPVPYRPADPPAARPVATGLQMKLRNPVAAWIGLPLITFGIYFYVWYYQIHREMAEFDRRRNVPTAGPLLVILLLSWTIIAPLVSYYNTGNRIRNAQRAAGMNPSASGFIGLLLMFVFGLGILYYQLELNKITQSYNVAEGTQVPLWM
ncbi:MAG: hypothetical protein V7646_578 [Pseudonocardia sp.]